MKGPDCIQKRRARSTGTIVGVYRPGAEAAPEEGWTTICEDHGGVVHHPTRALALSWAPVPEGWCPDCQESSGPE